MTHQLDPLDQNALAYKKLFRIENALRKLIEKECIKVYGHNWVKQKIPADIKLTINEGIKYAQRIKKHDPLIDSPLAYVDYSHLRQIIQKNDLWRDVFSKIFSKQDILGLLERSEIVRNAVAHNRIIGKGDIALLQAVESELIRDIGEQNFEKLIEDSTYTVTPADIIDKLKSYIGDMIKKIDSNDYSYLTSEWTNATSSWWFSEIYKDDDVDFLNSTFSTLRQYGRLPRDPRMGHIIYKWLLENELQSKLTQSKAILGGS